MANGSEWAHECERWGCMQPVARAGDFCPDHTQAPAADPAVSHPAHYTNGAIECIDAIAEAVRGLPGIEAFCVGNAIKYLWRHDMKGGTQDLEKAKWYIDRTIAERTKRGAK